jgi:hypothetical protein
MHFNVMTVLYVSEFKMCLCNNSGQRFFGMELEYTKRFLRLSRHFTVMSTVALLLTTDVVTLLLPHAAKNVSESLTPVCRLVFSK